MKVNIQRIIKVLSCFAVIAVVLLVSVFMPVSASVTVFSLSQLKTDVWTEDNNILVRYDTVAYGITPHVSVYRNGTIIQDTFNNFVEFDVDATTVGHAYAFYISPLGEPASSRSTAMLDISDLKSYSDYTLSASFEVDGGATNVLGNWYISGYWDVFYFDANKSFLSSATSDTTYFYPTSNSEQWIYDIEGSLQVPSNAVYIVPRVRYTISCSGGSAGGSAYVELLSSGFVTSVDSILESSACMNAIYDLLGTIKQSILDSNEKMDTVIDGTPEMNDQAQNKTEEQAEMDQKVDDAMDNYDSSTDLDNLLPEEADDPLGIGSIIERWILGDGWDALLEIITPILSHGHMPEILLMVVACINISVLLLGR